MSDLVLDTRKLREAGAALRIVATEFELIARPAVPAGRSRQRHLRARRAGEHPQHLHVVGGPAARDEVDDAEAPEHVAGRSDQREAGPGTHAQGGHRRVVPRARVDVRVVDEQRRRVGHDVLAEAVLQRVLPVQPGVDADAGLPERRRSSTRVTNASGVRSSSAAREATWSYACSGGLSSRPVSRTACSRSGSRIAGCVTGPSCRQDTRSVVRTMPDCSSTTATSPVRPARNSSCVGWSTGSCARRS